MTVSYTGMLVSEYVSTDPSATSTVGSTGPTSPQYAVVYDLISEGEIHGLVNGAASVYLNGTPLVAQSSSASVSSIVSGNGSFTSGNTTVTSSQVNLSGTTGRLILLERGGKVSSTFSANAGDFRLRAQNFFTANMAINPAFIGAARPKLRITGMGPRGNEYVGVVTQYIDANTAVVEPAIYTTGTNKSGGIDHVAIVNTATSNSLTVYVAPTVSGTKFQILPAGIPQQELAYNDNWNFKNTAVNFRVGTLNQTPITYADVPTASFLTSIEQSLEWTNTFNGLQSPLSYGAVSLGVAEAAEIDKIKIGIEFPAGLYKNTGEKQKIKSAFVGFQVKFQYTQGGVTKTAVILGPSSGTGFPSGKQTQSTWVNAISRYTGYYEAEVTSSFIHEIEIQVEQFKPFTNFSVFISRLNPHNSSDYESADDTIINGTNVKYIECQVLDKFRYPHSAYAAITFPSEGFSSVPGRSYHVRGIKVQVPSNYTTREQSATGASVYSGAWDGTFVTKYTNNPAWVFYDLATNKRYGLGKYVDPSLVDKYALYRIGRYCDELVPDGKGGMEPRFTCNVYIFEAEEAYKVLRDLATTFRGMMIWAQGALLAVQDSPKEPIYTFTQGNVIDGLFNYEYSGRLARYNEVNITWNNPDQFYQQDVLTVTDQTDIIKQGRVVSMSSVAFGCTSQGQAYRVALWNMLTSQLETEFISFATGMNANFLLPGDIINVQDHHLNAIQASGRIRSASGNTVTLDRDVTIASSTFNNRTTFENSLVSSGTDNFNSFVGNTGAKAASITRSSTNTASLGSYSYRANSTTGTLFIDSMDEYTTSGYSSAIANTSNNVGLTTSASRAGIVFSQFSPAISSLGMNISVETIANTTSEDYNVRGIASYRTFNAEIPLTVNVGYASGIVKSYNIVAGKDKFFGFSTSLSTNISNVSINFTSAVSSTNEFITIDNLILGNTSTAIQSTAHTLHVVFDGPGCYLEQSSAVISGTTYYRGDLIPGITTSIAATNLLDDSGNVVTTVFSEHTHVQKRSIVTPEPYVGNIIEVSSPFTSTPNVESIWALENATYDNNVEPKKYRVLSVKEEQGGAYSVIGSNYAAQKFDELESKVQIRDNTYLGPRGGQDIPGISDLTANYYRMDVDDEDAPAEATLYAFISWTPPVESFTDSNGNTSTRQYRYVDAYEVQHNFYDDVNTSYRDFITEIVAGNRNSLVVPTVSPGTYIIRVRVKNTFGQYSPWYSLEIEFTRASAAPGYDINGIRAGGSIDSAVVFEANTFTVIDDYYTFLNPLGQAYTVNAATSAQSSQSFQSLAANSTYFLMWDASDSTDPWKAIKYYYDTSIRTPYGSGNSYWSEAGASSNGLIQLPGTISATIGSRTVTGIGTYFTSNLSPGNLIKLQSSNNANSFYAIVAGISTNTSLTTKEVILKSFNAQTIHTPSLTVDYINDTIFSKIIKNASNIALEDIRYATSAIDEPQLLVLDADSNGFRYLAAGGLIGPSVINLSVNRQNLRGATDWYIYDANNNLLSNTLLNAKTNTSAQINSTSFGSVTNNSFLKITTNVGSLSSSYTVLKILDGANGANGTIGANGAPAVSLFLSRAGITLFAYAEGTVAAYTGASGQASLYSGDINVTENASWSSAQTVGLTGTVSNTSGSKGQYSVTNLATANDTGTLTVNAAYLGKTYTGQFSVAKAKGGYEIVSGSLPSTNLFEGRVVFFTGDDKLYRYNGSAWTSAVPAVDIDGELLSAQIANNAITTAKLVSNAVTQVKIATDAVGAAQVQVNAITVPKLAIAAPGSALNADPGMQDSTAWELYGGTSATFTTVGDGKVGNYVAKSTLSGSVYPMVWMNEIKRIPVDADKTYRVRAWMRTVSGSGNTAYMGVALFSNTGANISGDGSQWYYAASGITPPATWTEYVGTFGANTAKTFPSNARTMSPLFILSYSGGSSVVHEIQDLRIEEIIPSTLIRDDSITTPKLTANSITAAKISTDAIETRHLTANSIVAENLAANSIITRHLAANSVTAVSIAANAIVAGDIAANAVTAGSIAANAILAGNISANAVLAGTISANAVLAYNLSANSVIATSIAANSITADKINVGAITAAKISTTEAVITGTIQIANGIINNAKIIDLSADKINAGSINITTVGIQGTSATNFSIKSNTSGERLEMSTTTIRIYDTSGTLRVKIGNLT